MTKDTTKLHHLLQMMLILTSIILIDAKLTSFFTTDVF